MSVNPGSVIILHTYNFTAFDSLIALDTPFTNKFGITFVYKLPGPIIIPSASLIDAFTASAVFAQISFIAAKYKSEKVIPFNPPSVNL